MAPNAEGAPSNHVTLFSNGMGHFRRVVQIPAGRVEKISIPFKRDHIADVLESLSVFGNVRLASPPSFTPTNSNSTSLIIDPKNASRSLLTALSGATVNVHLVNDLDMDEYLDDEVTEDDVREALEGCTLLGIETVDFGDSGSTDMLSIVKDGEVTRFRLDDVHVEFTDESVKSEIEKALKNNYQKIKPDSTFLDLSVAGLDIDETAHDETAVIQYKIPVAAWKMRYNVRQEGEKFFLEGTAIIDNNTDEDWNDVLVSVVTGNPISFYSPDLAAVTVPQRQTVRIVDADALGAVAAADPIGGAPRMAAARGVAMRASASPMAYTSMANSASFGLECVSSADLCDQEFEAAAAIASSPGVDSKEVGDFCIFTSKEPISIASKRSAVVPMFTVALTSAGAILLYKEENHPRRPFRAVKFKNETDYSLGKGKVVIYQDGVFSGEAVLETAKPGENRLLPHCLENGVKIVKTLAGQEQRITGIRLASGVGYTDTTYTARTEYAITNKKAETFKVLVEHQNVLGTSYGQGGEPEFSGVEVKEVEKISGGVRLYLEIAPNESATLVVDERLVHTNQALLAGNYRWVIQNVVNSKNPLVDNAHIRVCGDLQSEIDRLSVEIKDEQAKISDLDEDAGRLRKNIEATKSAAKDRSSEAADITSKWIVELDNLDKEIRDIRKKQIPALEAERKRIIADLDAELKRVQADWTA